MQFAMRFLFVHGLVRQSTTVSTARPSDSMFHR